MRRSDVAREYAASTEHFDRIASAVPADLLDAREPGGWSARQVIHHVADSEAQSYARLRRLVAEPSGAIIQGYDEAAWARCQALGYEDLPVEHSLQVFRAVRAASLDVIERLTDDDLERVGHHTESGAYSVRFWLETYVAHPLDHAEQLRRAVEGVG